MPLNERWAGKLTQVVSVSATLFFLDTPPEAWGAEGSWVASVGVLFVCACVGQANELVSDRIGHTPG